MIPTIIFGGVRIEASATQADIDRILAGLHALGCTQGTTVAVMMRNSPAYVAVVLACRQAGLYLASINWHFKALEVEHILADSQSQALFIDADLIAQARAGIDSSVAVVATGVIDAPISDRAKPWDHFGAGLEPMPPRSDMQHSSIAYTSGTTGKPKGVRRIPFPEAVRAERDLELQHVTDIVYGAVPAMVAYLSAPIYHSAAMGYIGHVARHGATLVLEPRFDALRTLQLIDEHRVTHAYLVPTMYQRLLGLTEPVRQAYDLTSLLQVASTGSPCPETLKRGMIEWFGPIITEAYGSSEAGYTTFIDSHQWLAHPGSAGQMLPTAQVRILDDEGAQLDSGSTGLIYVRQFSVPDFSYINRPDARAAIERDGLITLGDMGYLDQDGYLYICDRKADMVISGGVNIYPAEIEAVLMTMPAVADCAVFGIPSAEFGEGLAAAVQLKRGHEADTAMVQSYLRERIANYKVPQNIEFHDTLPREDSGKIFKRLLRQPHWEGHPRAI